jgi:DNA-binding transcriptional regulator YhcF (GntR family)
MIGYRLDTHSGLAPYLQLVQQTKDALRLGLLHPGDQLPTVKEVVASIAINPNTVLKAYRELERDGLIEGRPGVGTFVLKTLGSPNADHPRLRRRLERWVDDAREGGLDDDSISALFDATLRGSLQQEDIA